MSSISKIVAAIPQEIFRDAIEKANAWRGRCLHHFARSEVAVTETLLALSRVPGRGDQVRLRHLIGQRYEDLTTALSADGPFKAEAGKALTALNDFRAHDHLRSALCHGLGDVTLGIDGSWTLVLRILSLKSGREVRETVVFDQSESSDIQERLNKDAASLCSHLKTLRELI